jgi:hypothetical protein
MDSLARSCGSDGLTAQYQDHRASRHGTGRVLFKEMSHGFSPISTNQLHKHRMNLLVMSTGPGVRRLLFENDRKRIRENLRASVAKASA